VSSLHTNNFSRAIPRPFGAANWVTFARALFAVALLIFAVGAIWQGVPVSVAVRWFIVAVAAVSLFLDGLDGYLARRLAQASAFGARFDMETDALTMLALAFAVWAAGQAGAWVLAGGAMRYIFIVAGLLWPAVAAPLPPRKRRQTVCVIQLVALIVALVPVVPLLAGSAVCLAGLILLGYSFGVDLVWLAGQARLEGKAAC
jgi:phosphatidylglycerophosphate synthase